MDETIVAKVSEIDEELGNGMMTSGDDVVIPTKVDDFKEHVKQIATFLEVSLKGRWQLSLAKTNIGARVLEDILGYLATGEYHSQGRKQLKTKQEARSLEGMFGFFAPYIRYFTDRMEPIRRLTRRNARVKMTEEIERAIGELKEEVTKRPTLAHIRRGVRITMWADASEHGIGVVLTQEGKMVGVASRVLQGHEKAYSSVEREALALLFGFEKFGRILRGTNPLLLTDHKPMLDWAVMKMELGSGTLGRILRKLSDFGFELKYKKGEEMLADAPSRLVVEEMVREEVVIEEIEKEKRMVWREEQKEEKELREWMEKLVRFPPTTDTSLPRDYVGYLLDKDGVLCRRVKRAEKEAKEGWWVVVVVPKGRRKETLEAAHGIGHGSRDQMWARLRERVDWKGMREDCKVFGRTCETCVRRRVIPDVKGLLGSTPPVGKWNILFTDICGPLPKTIRGNRYLAVLIDSDTRYIELTPLEDVTTASMTRGLEANLKTHGLPQREVRMDGASYQVSAEAREHFRVNDLQVHAHSPYNHDANGSVENAIKQVKETIMKVSLDDQWDISHVQVQMAWNSNEGRRGVSPYELMTGRKMMLPGYLSIPTPNVEMTRQKQNLRRVFRKVQSSLAEERRKQAERYDKGRKMVRFKRGDLVWLARPDSGEEIEGDAKENRSFPYCTTDVAFDVQIGRWPHNKIG